jgi:hypothetical protein
MSRVEKELEETIKKKHLDANGIVRHSWYKKHNSIRSTAAVSSPIQFQQT